METARTGNLRKVGGEVRRAHRETLSGVSLLESYGPTDGELPGKFPFTRGPHPSMYRTRLWTIRQFAGFGTAADTNARFKSLLDSGGTGLSVAFDMPTLLGKDSDDPLARGEVGRAGVAVDSFRDMSALFDGIDLGSVSTSMTINSPAAVVMAMFIALADHSEVPRSKLSGTIQNDILKEYQAQKEYVFPPRPSMRLVTDLIAFASAELPCWHPISVSGYHIREAGSTAAQELAFTLANGFAYVEAAIRSGLLVDDFAPRLSFFFNAHIDLFEEVAKYRAARRIWARWMRNRFGAMKPASEQLRFHSQTSGVSLTAQQPETNLVRIAVESMAAVMGGTQSLHADSFDEALALPSKRAATLALRTQQIIAEESGIANVADPLGGSYLVESLTDELEARAEATFAHIEEAGSGSILEGVISCVEDGWYCDEIAESAFGFQSKVASGDWIQVGVNGYRDDSGEAPPTLYIDPSVEQKQLENLAATKRNRDSNRVQALASQIAASAADPTVNLMPVLIEAAKSHVTVGESMAALQSVFGTWTEGS